MERAGHRIFGSPRSSDRLAEARAWLRDRDRAAPLLVLGEPAEAPVELLHDVLGEGMAWFGWQRATLDGLALELATPALAASGLVKATPLALEAVCIRMVSRLLAAGRLDRFTPIARLPGFAVALGRTLAELRDAGTPAHALPPGLAAALDAYEAELAEWRLADRAMVLDLAARAPFPAVPVLWLDHPLRPGVAERLVAALAARAPEMLATVPHGDPASDLLARAMGVEAAPVARPEPSTALGRLQGWLFEDPPSPAAHEDSVELVSAPWDAREAVEIARRVLREAERGVPFDQVAVLLRDVAAYRPHLEEAFRRADVPAWFVRGHTQPDPAGRALLALLTCAAEGLSARGFAEYLSLGELPGDEVLTPRSWERLLVDASVIGGGPARWARRLDGLRAEALSWLDQREPDAPGADRVRRRVDHLATLRDFALPLLERLHTLPVAATWGEWLVALRGLASAALARPDHVLELLAELDPLADVGPVGLDEVRHVLHDRLRDLGRAPAEQRYGRVFVGPTEAARGRSFAVVFVPGLVERAFPRRITEDPLLPDHERPPGLRRRDDQAIAERLALRLAVGAARDRVVLSWPRADTDEGRPRVPSTYALDVLRAIDGSLPDFAGLEQRCTRAGARKAGWPVPDDRSGAIDDTEHDLFVLKGALDALREGRRTGVDVTARLKGAARYLLTTSDTLARSIRARARRWNRRWSGADGLLEASPAAREALARRLAPSAPISATALEHFAQCPYRFYLRTALRLAPVEVPRAIETLDPRSRGALFHEVQFAVLGRLRHDAVTHLPAALRGLVDDALEVVAADWHDRLSPAIERVWADAVEEVRADLHEWILRLHADPAWSPLHAELGLGLPPSPRLDPASDPEPVDLSVGLRLRGAIDLVEVDATGALRVTDHKTGASPPPDGIVTHGGRVLQPVLYALAAERRLGRPVGTARLWYCTHRAGFTERVVTVDPRARQVAAEVVRLWRERIDRAELPAAPDKGACTWCEFAAVCGPHEEKRLRNKPGGELADLRALRDLP